MPRDVVVIGASAGGIEALRSIVSGFPGDFSASVFVVMHTSPDSPGVLASILSRAGPLPAVHVDRAEKIKPGVIYVASPDRHLLIEPGRVVCSRGPKENRFRPAVDPLFRSAAQTYGPRVTGVILTGGLDDGAAGLWTIKQLGGTAVVQDPRDALMSGMPRHALEYVQVDHVVPLAEIAPLLVRLVKEPSAQMGDYVVPDEVNIEVNISKETAALEAGVLKLGEPSNFACPECHGVLLKLKEGNRHRFRCHTGHAYSIESLLAEINGGVEDSLWTAIRSIEESRMLLVAMAEHAAKEEDRAAVALLRQKLDEADRRADLVRQAVQCGGSAP